MRYRTAGILSAILVIVNVGMFALPAVAWAVLLPSMERGIDPPLYVRLTLRLPPQTSVHTKAWGLSDSSCMEAPSICAAVC